MDIEEQLKQIIYKQLGNEITDIDENTDIIEDLGADSLDIVEMLMMIEDQFGVTIPDDDIPGLRTFGNTCHRHILSFLLEEYTHSEWFLFFQTTG